MENVFITKKDARNICAAANAVAEGLVSESARKFFVAPDREVAVLADGDRLLVVEDKEHDEKILAFMRAGVDAELLVSLRDAGHLAKLRMPSQKHCTRKAMVQEALDLLIEMQTGEPAEQHDDEEDSFGDEDEFDEEINEVILAGYHKDLGYSRPPKINHEPSWFK
jgi:hypothetical protein